MLMLKQVQQPKLLWESCEPPLRTGIIKKDGDRKYNNEGCDDGNGVNDYCGAIRPAHFV